MPKPSIIALDGPLADVKSTIGRLLVRKLTHCFADTGAMYGALTWEATMLNTDPEDEDIALL